MNAMLADNLLRAWLAMTALSVTAIAAVVVWAIRSGQFRNQEHARHLPLEIEAPDGPAKSGPLGPAPLKRAGLEDGSRGAPERTEGPDA